MNLVPLITELGIDKLTPEEQKPIFESIFRTLSMRVSRRLASDLSEEELQQLEQTFTSGGDTAVLTAVQQRHPDLEPIYQEELDAIKENIKAILPQ